MLSGSQAHFLLAYAPSCFFGATMSSVNQVSDKLTRRCDQARETLADWQKSETYLGDHNRRSFGRDTRVRYVATGSR